MSEMDDDDALAAEYVIGTLPTEEMQVAESRRRHDREFDILVHEWTDRLAPLLDMIPSVEPSPHLREAVLAEVDSLRLQRNALAETGPGNVVQLRRQVLRWRAATLVSAAIAALLAIWIASARMFPRREAGTYVAVLQQGAGAPSFLVSLDLASRRMTVIPSEAAADPNKSLELWMIGSNAGTPRSLGLLDASSPVNKRLPDVSLDMISRATYAITLEPKGGSPDGKPSAAPVFTGHLVPASTDSRG